MSAGANRTTSRPRVYLAGPAVFRSDATSYGEALKAKCERAGLAGCFPLDIVGEQTSARRLAQSIHRANIKLIDSACAIVADISPFRGPNMDPGTAWEIGYGVAKGLRIFAWSADRADILTRTRRAEGLGAGSDRAVDQDGLNIENFGLIENLMIAVSCASIHDNEDAAIWACARALGTA
jgi:nucleoside 2-deoxyribosyltransferase